MKKIKDYKKKTRRISWDDLDVRNSILLAETTAGHKVIIATIRYGRKEYSFNTYTEDMRFCSHHSNDSKEDFIGVLKECFSNMYLAETPQDIADWFKE